MKGSVLPAILVLLTGCGAQKTATTADDPLFRSVAAQECASSCRAIHDDAIGLCANPAASGADTSDETTCFAVAGRALVECYRSCR